MAGTTIKENGVIYSALYNTLRDMNYDIDKTQVSTWGGKDKHEVLHQEISKFEPNEAILEKKCKIANIQLLNTLNNEYFNHNSLNLIDPYLPCFLEKLKFNNIDIALNTGYPKSFQKDIIDYLHMDEFINDYISSEEVKYGRPYPYMIHRLMERFDIENVKNVAKVGDTIMDMKEGKNAGCGLVIGVLSGVNNKEELFKYGADMVLDSIMDLNDDTNTFDFLL